jgi:hypothetical protein
VAAELGKEPDVEVELVKGGFAEFSVDIDGRRCIEANRLSYPRPSRVLEKIRAMLAKRTEAFGA